MNETPTDIITGHHRLEREALHRAQVFMIEAAAAIDVAARHREFQGDEHAERDAATYRETAKLLRGEMDDLIISALSGPIDPGFLLAQVAEVLHADALVRMIRNDPP